MPLSGSQHSRHGIAPASRGQDERGRHAAAFVRGRGRRGEFSCQAANEGSHQGGEGRRAGGVMREGGGRRLGRRSSDRGGGERGPSWWSAPRLRREAIMSLHAPVAPHAALLRTAAAVNPSHKAIISSAIATTGLAATGDGAVARKRAPTGVRRCRWPLQEIVGCRSALARDCGDRSCGDRGWGGRPQAGSCKGRDVRAISLSRPPRCAW